MSSADWLESKNVADPVLAEPLRAVDRTLTAASLPGGELLWDEEVVRRYRVF
jgi:hypothetical protein